MSKPIITLMQHQDGGEACVVRVISGPSRRGLKFTNPKQALLWHERLVRKGWETTTPSGIRHDAKAAWRAWRLARGYRVMAQNDIQDEAFYLHLTAKSWRSKPLSDRHAVGE